MFEKKLPDEVAAPRAKVEPKYPQLNIRRQCELLGLHRSSWYYQPVRESNSNLYLMRLIDEHYNTRTPFYGWPRMAATLRRQGLAINHKRVQRLMQQMGLQAICPKPTQTVPGHQAYPYLLRALVVTRPDQVWSADITYVPMAHGFMYLVAIIDWSSCYVVACQLSNTLDGWFCTGALQKALQQGKPDIHNTDQGVQLTATDLTTCLAAAGVRIRMDIVAGPWITSLWNNYGAPSSTKTST